MLICTGGSRLIQTQAKRKIMVNSRSSGNHQHISLLCNNCTPDSKFAQIKGFSLDIVSSGGPTCTCSWVSLFAFDQCDRDIARCFDGESYCVNQSVLKKRARHRRGCPLVDPGFGLGLQLALVAFSRLGEHEMFGAPCGRRQIFFFFFFLALTFPNCCHPGVCAQVHLALTQTEVIMSQERHDQEATACIFCFWHFCADCATRKSRKTAVVAKHKKYIYWCKKNFIRNWCFWHMLHLVRAVFFCIYKVTHESGVEKFIKSARHLESPLLKCTFGVCFFVKILWDHTIPSPSTTPTMTTTLPTYMQRAFCACTSG